MNELEGYNKKDDNDLNLLDRIKKIWSNIPLFIKFFLITSFIFYILNIFIKSISFFLSNIPYYTIYHFQLWRLITTVFISTNLFKYILGLICWIKYASSLETSIGTIKYMTIFLSNTIFIQIIYCLLKYIILKIFKKDNIYLIDKYSIKGVNNISLWGNIICELTLLCLSNPESPNKLLLIPFIIKAKYYPFLLVLVFTFVNSLKIDLEVISGIIYAYIYFYCLKNFLKFSDNFAQIMEDKICCKFIIRINGFISVSNINNGNPFSITNVSVNPIKVNNIKYNEMEEINIQKGATIQGTDKFYKDEYRKFKSNDDQ